MQPDASSPPAAPFGGTNNTGPEALAAVAAARRVNRALRVSVTGDDVRTEVARLLDQAAELLEAETHPGPHCQVGFGPPDFGEGAQPAQYFPYSPIVGPLNPLSPPVDFQIQPDRSVRGTVTLHEGYNGP